MSNSGRPAIDQPDFIRNALDTLRAFGEGALRNPVVQTGLQGLDALYRTTIEAPEGLYGVGLQKLAESAGGGRGREEQAVTSAVTAETDKIDHAILRAVATPFLYAAGASEAKRIAARQAAEQGVIPSLETPLGRVSALDVAELGLPLGGLVEVGSKAPAFGRLVTQGAATPKGLIASRMEELVGQGLTEPQAFNAVQHQFGAEATQRWATTGNDVFLAAPHEAGAAAQGAVAAGRAAGETPQKIEQAQRIGEAPQVIPGGVTPHRPTLAGSPETQVVPTAAAPKIGSGAPRENLGVNLDKIEAPAEAKDYIRQVANQNAGFAEQRRGVMTTAETQAAADKIALEAEKLAYLRPGAALNAEQITAVRDALVSKGNEVTRFQEAVRAQEAAGVAPKEATLRLLAAAAEHQTLQRVYAGVRAESGRALRIQREISGGLARGDINGTYQRAVELLGGKDTTDTMVRRLQDIWTDPRLSPTEREIATYRFVQNLDRATTADKVQEFWTNAILSSPVTHLVNITGQTLLHLADTGTNFLTAAVEVVSTLGGIRRPRERTFSGAFGALASLGDGFRRGVLNLRDAEKVAATKFRETGRLSQGPAIGSGFSASRLERGFGAVVNVPTKLLGAEDAVFRGLGEARGLYETAYDIAAREKLRPLSAEFAKRVADLLNDPTDEMLARAKQLGERASLRQPAGEATQLFIRLRDALNVPGTGFKPLRYAVPFITTPINLVKVGAEYSPLGFVRAISRTGGARSEAIARAGLGSAAMGYFAQQYALGNITAAAPIDPAARDAFYATGKIPYAVKLGDTWYSFSRLEPVATPLKWTAALMQSAKDNEGQSWDVVAGKMVFSLARLMEDSTYLSGLSNLIDAMQDPSKAAKFVQGTLGGFNPAFVRTLVQSNDPYIRDPKGIWQQIEATLPYLNEQVPPKQTVYGEPVTRTEGKQGIAGLISPVDFSREKVDPITAKMQSYDLPESLGPDGQPLPARALNVGFVSQEIAALQLNPEEGRRYQTLAGQATRNLLEKLFADELPYTPTSTRLATPFSRLAYEDQIRAIRKTVSDARDAGRAQLADELVSSAKTDQQVARGALMRLSTLDKLRDKARYLDGLRVQGMLTPLVRAGIDRRRGDDPPVSEFLKYAPLVSEYLALDPYVIGNSTEWASLRDARATMTEFLRVRPAPPGWTQIDWFQFNDPKNGSLVRRYSYENVRNYQRVVLLRRYPGLERYVSGA